MYLTVRSYLMQTIYIICDIYIYTSYVIYIYIYIYIYISVVRIRLVATVNKIVLYFAI